MLLTEKEFDDAVEELKRLAEQGASVRRLLESAKANIAARSNVVRALVAFYRAFDVPLGTAVSLGSWIEFSGTNPGCSAEELEAEYGSFLRSHIRPRTQKEE